MMRFKLTIEYAGTRYSGWQIQKNARTVQGELARAVATVIESADFELYGSGRTDAGVHALAQVAHLEAHTPMQPEPLRRRLNEELPADINVLKVEKVRHRFHARHSVVGRSYIYQVSRRRTAFAKPFVWWVKDELDVERMRLAARRFVGFHDFRAFSDVDPEETSTDVLIDTLGSCGANLSVTSGPEAVDAAIEPLTLRGVIVAENGRLRVRDRNVLRYYARSLDHLLESPSRRTH